MLSSLSFWIFHFRKSLLLAFICFFSAFVLPIALSLSQLRLFIHITFLLLLCVFLSFPVRLRPNSFVKTTCARLRALRGSAGSQLSADFKFCCLYFLFLQVERKAKGHSSLTVRAAASASDQNFRFRFQRSPSWDLGRAARSQLHFLLFFFFVFSLFF